MGKYVENNLQKNETVVKKAKITLLYVILHITNIFVIPLIVRLIKYCNIELAVTSKRIVGKVGVIKTQSLDSPINKVQNTEVKQGLGGKLFGYGTIIITTAAGSYNFVGVKKPNEFKSAVMAQIEQYEEEKIRLQSEQMARAMAQAVNK